MSSKSHASTLKGDDEYGDVEVRTLQTICALLAALDSLFQRGPLLTMLHSKLPTLLLGNAQEHISLNLPNTLPQMDSYFENVNNINKVFLDMKNKRLEEMQQACQVASEQITIEKATIDAMRQKLSASLALTILSMHLGDSKNMQVRDQFCPHALCSLMLHVLLCGFTKHLIYSPSLLSFSGLIADN